MPAPDLSRATWRKSSRSNGQGGACVEIGLAEATRGIRDTKDRSYGTLVFDADAFATFLSTVKSGQLDLR